jgi:hypothetical protein
MDKARVRVDFNELVQDDLVLLSKDDLEVDSKGNEVNLYEGLHVSVYESNEYENGAKELLLAEGVAELNDPKTNGEWSKAAKWCCRINSDGIVVKNT